MDKVLDILNQRYLNRQYYNQNLERERIVRIVRAYGGYIFYYVPEHIRVTRQTLLPNELSVFDIFHEVRTYFHQHASIQFQFYHS
jgi:hypothetical protein